MGREEETALVEKYMYLVQQIARNRFSSRLPDDDLLQTGLIGLWEAAQKWNGNGSFKSYARVCIYHNMLDHVRGLNAKKRSDGEDLEEWDDYTLDRFDDLDVMELMDDIDKAWPRESMENKVLRGLAVERDKRVLAAQMELTTYQLTRIAKRAWRAVQRAREEKE